MLALLRPTVILGILLALSLAGNVGLYKLHSWDLQKIGGLQQAAKDAVADAKACSEGVEKLRKEAAARDKRAAEALKGAETRAREADARADATLQERPSQPDPCAAARELNQRKLKERHP